MTLEKELNPKGIKMNSFLVRYRVGNKNFEEEIFADNEKAVKESIEMQAEWDFPKKKVKIISLEETNEYVDMYNLEHLNNNKTWFANGILVKE